MVRISKEAEKFFLKPKGIIILLLIIIAIAGIAIATYSLLTYKKVCDDEVCFAEALTNCSKAIYLSNNQETVVRYTILGASEKTCLVNVEMLQIKQGFLQVESMVGKEMVCTAPLGVYILPDENIKNCHGLLKEEIQDILLQRLYSQIAQNIEQIGKEIAGNLLGI